MVSFGTCLVEVFISLAFIMIYIVVDGVRQTNIALNQAHTMGVLCSLVCIEGEKFRGLQGGTVEMSF